MDFQFSYDIYPHPPMFCNNAKVNMINKKMFNHSQLCLNHEIQLDTRPKLTRCCRYNDPAKDNFPSSCNYIGGDNEDVYIPNTGYYKYYFQNIDVETDLLQATPARPIPKPTSNAKNEKQPPLQSCLESCGALQLIKDNDFPVQNPQMWNNNTKRKFLSGRK